MKLRKENIRRVNRESFNLNSKFTNFNDTLSNVAFFTHILVK